MLSDVKPVKPKPKPEDGEGPRDAPQIRNIALEKACKRGINLQGHSRLSQLLLLVTSEAVYDYRFLLVACCYNISI